LISGREVIYGRYVAIVYLGKNQAFFNHDGLVIKYLDKNTIGTTSITPQQKVQQKNKHYKVFFLHINHSTVHTVVNKNNIIGKN
jgi:hypothetical protein